MQTYFSLHRANRLLDAATVLQHRLIAYVIVGRYMQLDSMNAVMADGLRVSIFNLLKKFAESAI